MPNISHIGHIYIYMNNNSYEKTQIKYHMNILMSYICKWNFKFQNNAYSCEGIVSG